MRIPAAGPLRLFLLALLLTGFAAAAFGLDVAAPGEGGNDPARADIVLLVAYVSIALFFSFLCSLAEATLLSITPSYVAELEQRQPARAARLMRLKNEDLDRSLAAILTLNTIAHTAGAIGAGAKAAIVFGNAWFGAFSAAMTLTILFLTEIVPKTMGAVHWRRLSGAMTLFVRGLIFGLYPLILVSERLTKWIAKGQNVHVFSRDEFIAMAGIGERTGQIHPNESRILRNLFRFGSLKAGDVMTPQPVVSALQEDMTVTDALKAGPDTPFSRLPLYRKNIDEVSGFVLKNDMLLAQAQGRGDIALATLKRDITAVNTEKSLSGLLEMMLDNRLHIALVVGEYGETKGIVTLEDVVETLLGMEIVDEKDTVEDLQALARLQWRKRAMALGLDLEPDRDVPVTRKPLTDGDGDDSRNDPD